MRKHTTGCTEKCRVKNSALELDLDRNQVLVDSLTKFDWCNTCARSSGPQGPPSGAKMSYAPCTNGCGNRLLGQCKPLMEKYGEADLKIQSL